MAKKTAVKKSIGKLKLVEVFAITANKKNPRTVNVKAESFNDLVDSIKARGVTVPVHVRPVPGGAGGPGEQGYYELLAGSRRVAAAQVAELGQIPAIDHGDISDAEAFEITFAENFARQDLTPIEQGKASVMLLAEYKDDVRAAASKMGKSVTWLRTHAAIANGLIDKIQKHLAEFPDAPWTASHLAVIARLPEWLQKELAYSYFGMYPVCIEDMQTVSDLEAELAGDMRLMSTATWQLDEKFGKLPACDGCLNRTGTQPELFDVEPELAEVASKNDKCMNPKCWKAKCVASLKTKVDELKNTHPDLALISVGKLDYSQRDSLREKCESSGGFLEKGFYKIVGKTTAGAIPAMTVNGSAPGAIKYIKLDSCVSENKNRSSSSSSAAPAKPTPLAQRRKLHESKRWQQVLRAMCVAVKETSFDQVFRAGSAKTVLQGVLKMAVTFGTTHEHGDFDDFAKIGDVTDDALLEKLWSLIRPRMVSNLTYNGNITQVPKHYIKDAKLAAEILSINIDAMYADEVKAQPEPKS